MEKLRKITSKAFAAIAIIGVFVAVGTVDNSPNEMTARLIGVAALAIGLAGWSLTKEEAAS